MNTAQGTPKRRSKRRFQKFIGRVQRAGCMLRGAEGMSRVKLASYLALGVTQRIFRAPIVRREMDLNLSGLRVRVQTFSSQLGAYADIFHLGEYEKVPGFESAPGEIVIDAGANVGFFSLRHAPLVGSAGRVYAFEPNPEVYALLDHNVRTNGFGQVRCLRAALADNAGTVRFSADERSTSCGHIALENETGSLVEAMTLDQLVETEGIDRIDLLKMDVEGHEPHIIRGGLRRAMAITRRVVMESHMTRHEVWSMLEPLGFLKVYDGSWPNVCYFARPNP